MKHVVWVAVPLMLLGAVTRGRQGRCPTDPAIGVSRVPDAERNSRIRSWSVER